MRMPTNAPALFTPTQIGDISLNHRVVLAPLTRFRANKNNVHGDLAVKYYSQRSSTPGTLLITEGTTIGNAAGASGYDNIPMVETDEQLAGLKRITDAVHAQGSHIFTQLAALGRTADPEILKRHGLPFAAASNIPLDGRIAPEPLTRDQINDIVKLYGVAASNAVHRSGFDGVEIHGANGYLIDQFTSDTTNNRTDKYGGSVENRTRFVLEVIESVVKAIGESKTAIRFSPWSERHGMRMKDPKHTYAYLVTQFKERFPNLAYIHVVEPIADDDSNDFIRDIWSPRPIISAGGYTLAKALPVAEEKGDLIAFWTRLPGQPRSASTTQSQHPLEQSRPHYLLRCHERERVCGLSIRRRVGEHQG